jgi:hypothetical protein
MVLKTQFERSMVFEPSELNMDLTIVYVDVNYFMLSTVCKQQT